MDDFYSEVESNIDLEKDGIYLTIGTKMAAVIARAGGQNRAYESARDALAKPYTRQIQAGMMKGAEITDKILKPAYARAVVKDFLCVKGDKAVSGIPPHPSWGSKKEELNGDGLLPVNEANLLRLFRTPGLGFVWDTIADAADQVANFRKEVLEAKAKN